MQREIKISFKAILAGCAADVFSTRLLFGLLGWFVVLKYGFNETNPQIFVPQIVNAIGKSPVLFGINTMIGLVCSILGGYVAARVAKQNEVENAIAASLVVVTFDVYVILVGDPSSLALNVFFTLITPFFYRLGAQARIQQIAKRS